jgi:hypothetical protein
VGGLAEDSAAVDILSTSELESYVAARKVLAPAYALHVAVSEHAQAVSQLGKSTLQEAVQFFLRHHKSEVGRISLATLTDQFGGSRVQSGFSDKYVKNCQRHGQMLAEAFAGCSISDLSTEALYNGWEVFPD